MARRALLIRSDYDALEGFPNSLECMAQVLALPRFGFTTCRCEGEEATRAGILQALRRLIDNSSPDDVVAIYYVGHGVLTTLDHYQPGGDLPPSVQNICPTDYAATTQDDFRGVSMFELSMLVDELTKITKNVTIILDCCFASMMVRSVALEARSSIPKLTVPGLIRHLQSLDPKRATVALDPVGNPYAVRVAASDQTGAALPVMLPDALQLAALGLDLPADGWISAMTFRLAEVLVHVNDARISWRAIGSELRSRMAVQRPEIEGPDLRVPFTLMTVSPNALGLRSDGQLAVFDAGRLHGVSVGDVYAVLPDGTAQLDDHTSLGTVTVTTASIIEARGPWSGWSPSRPSLPLGAVAVPISLAFERVAVAVAGSTSDRAAILAALEASPRVRPARGDEPQAIAELRSQDGAIELSDPTGLLLETRGPEGLADALAIVERLATVHRLRAMPTHQGLAASDIATTLVKVDGDSSQHMPCHGASLQVADRIAIHLENRGTEPRFVSVFNIGLQGAISRLNGQVGGIALLAGERAYLGEDNAHGIRGLAVEWPESLPCRCARLDTILVTVTDAPVDLGMLAGGGARAPLEQLSPLELLAAQLSTGRPRAAVPGNAFALIWLDYWVSPPDLLRASAA